jgi:high-affinity nickel permease
VFGLDERLAAVSDGASLLIVLGIAALLGLRHATDPDHLAAVTTLVASGRERAAPQAGALGLAWGLGHGTTLVGFGLPAILLNGVLPPRVQQGAETAIGLVIVNLAIRLLVRWRRGGLRFYPHPHAHGVRTRWGAFAIGLVHGLGGSAGIGVLVLASARSASLAVASLLVLAVFTAVSMSLLSRGLGSMLVSRPVRATFGAMAPALGAASLAFGVWYATAAWT